MGQRQQGSVDIEGWQRLALGHESVNTCQALQQAAQWWLNLHHDAAAAIGHQLRVSAELQCVAGSLLGGQQDCAPVERLSPPAGLGKMALVKPALCGVEPRFVVGPALGEAAEQQEDKGAVQAHAGVHGRQGDGEIQHRQCLMHAAGVHEGDGKAVVICDLGGALGQSLAQHALRFAKLPLLAQHEAENAECVVIIGTQCQGAARGLLGLFELTELAECCGQVVVGFRPFGRKRQGRGQCLDRLGRAILFAKTRGEIEVGVWVCGIEGKLCAEGGFGFRRPSLPTQGAAEVTVQPGQCRAECHRLAIGGFSLFVAAEQQQDVAHVAPPFRAIRLQLQGILKTDQCLRGAPEGFEGGAEIVQCLGVIRSQLKRALIGEQGFLVPVEMAEGHAEIGEEAGRGPDFKCAADQLHGARWCALGVLHHAQKMKRVCIIWVGAEHGAIGGFRLRQPACSVLSHAGFQHLVARRHPLLRNFANGRFSATARAWDEHIDRLRCQYRGSAVAGRGMRVKTRVLVTGGAGFLGSHLCERLLTDGHSVLCVDNYFTGRRENIAHLLAHPDFEALRHDVTFPLHVEVDQIYNLACPASPVHYQHDPVQTTKTSVMGAINMLGLAKRLKVPVLQASTSEVYGDPTVHPQTEAYWGNVNPIGPRACYDEGKRCAETLFFDYHRQHRVSIKVARIFNTYGPRMLPNDGRVVSNFIVQALRGQDITIYGDGGQTRAFCYVDDLVDGLVRMMATGETVTGPINIGNPAEISVRLLAERVVALTGSSARLVFRPLPQDDPMQRCPDIRRAQEVLGWTPIMGLDDGLGATIAYFRRLLA